MRALVVNTFLTLDGVMQAPGGPDEDPTGGFTHGGWAVEYWDDGMMARMTQAMSVPFDLLLGRVTYEIFAAHWPRMAVEGDPDDPFATVLNDARKYVASTTLDKVEWNNSTLLQGDVAPAVATLKEQDGPQIQVHGSSRLLQTLIAHGLVDEYRLWFFPLVLGSGKRLFGDGTVPAGLELVDSATSTTGVVTAAYRRGSDVAYGSFTFEEPDEAELARREKLAGG